ncbi:MAG TPA: endonuclease NucS domain-containing protein, partial [Tepidisphaeraceae bacterium]|nr:endonuclease NucS domain-containing protein [Tepidisphaeraceae bacterium]
MPNERSIFRVDLENRSLQQVGRKAPQELGAREKDIEDLLVKKPEMIFSDPDAVLIIGREVSGESIADVLAVDSQGDLIVVELKRADSDRSTVAQLLDYASRLTDWAYDQFNERWKRIREGSTRKIYSRTSKF